MPDAVAVDFTRRNQVGLEQPSHRQRTADLRCSGGLVEDFIAVRYLDNYRRCADGKWRFSKRVVTYDMKTQRPFTGGGLMALGEKDPSYQVCTQRLFQRGPRAQTVAAE